MNPLSRTLCCAAALLAGAACAQPAPPAPGFDVAYRAWDIVTELARLNRDPGISGECGKTFRPFVIPGLKMQSKPDQDRAAVGCRYAARAACANARLQRPPDMTGKCGEFR
jgi:hypothetical protein